MRIAYLDCFAGISGDMFLGALLDAGVPVDVLHEATSALGLDASLEIERVDRSGIASTKVHVLVDGKLAEEAPHNHFAENSNGDEGETVQHQGDGGEFEHTQQIRTQHQHKEGHTHSHIHTHEHGQSRHSHPHQRSLSDIRTIIHAAPLDENVKGFAVRVFEFLGHAEAKVHNVPIEQIHFHEVGAVDAIVDIVASSAGIHYLNVGVWYSSPVNMGGGMIDCAHGRFPVPAPATADLLRGFPTYSAHVQKELVTPTGAALLRALGPSFGQQPVMCVEAIGYGAGTRDPEGFPNVLRLGLGEQAPATATTPAPSHASQRRQPQTTPSQARDNDEQTESVTILETAVDDLSPQVLAHVSEQALAAGALDVMLTPVIMKKGRPGTLLTVLCRPVDASMFEDMLLNETSTLGVRIRQERRITLERSHVPVDTRFGPVRIKVGSRHGVVQNAAPEFEDCKAAAEQHQVPLKLVQQEAIAVYRRPQS